MRKSQVVANSVPPARQCPWICAMTGFASSQMIQFVITTCRAHCVAPGWVLPVSGSFERRSTKLSSWALRAGVRS